jgi:glycogen operon protein
MANRLLGSPDVFRRSGRCARASINLVTCHDGFTLRDLVSYEYKHNEANGEGNRDGSDQNYSWNHGVEGETHDQTIRARRELDQRNLLTTLLVARGVPMLLAGDERGRTQRGNNNAYCQDNELSWIDWEHGQEDLRDFCARLIRLRRGEGALRQDILHRGEFPGDSRARDVAFFLPDGREMVGKDWDRPISQSFACLFGGDEVRGAQRRPSPPGRSVLVLFNASAEAVSFRLPGKDWGDEWQLAVDTKTAQEPPAIRLTAGVELTCAAHAMMVLRRPGESP